MMVTSGEDFRPITLEKMGRGEVTDGAVVVKNYPN